MGTIFDAVRELELISKPTKLEKQEVTSSHLVAEYARNLYKDDLTIYESFYVLFLDQSNKVIAYVRISQGGVSATVVDVRLVMLYAVKVLASGIIIVHNHPSGNLKASQADINITRNIKMACELFQIKLLDHIILTKDSFNSIIDMV